MPIESFHAQELLAPIESRRRVARLASRSLDKGTETMFQE